MILDVLNAKTYMYFRINGTTVASLTSTNQLLLDDPNRYGLNMSNNDLSNVYRLDAMSACLSTAVINTVTGTNASFVNTSLTNVSIVNFYADPAVIDYCCFTHNVCMNNYSIVNLDVSGFFSVSKHYECFVTKSLSIFLQCEHIEYECTID